MPSQSTIIYLLHFERPYRHARHYLGSTDDLDARLACHAEGQGAKLMRVIKEAGISWQCVRTWQGDRKLERRLKRRKGTPALCPVCSGESAWKRASKVGKR